MGLLEKNPPNPTSKLQLLPSEHQGRWREETDAAQQVPCAQPSKLGASSWGVAPSLARSCVRPWALHLLLSPRAQRCESGGVERSSVPRPAALQDGLQLGPGEESGWWCSAKLGWSRQTARLPPTNPSAKPLYHKLLWNAPVSPVGSKKKRIPPGELLREAQMNHTETISPSP